MSRRRREVHTGMPPPLPAVNFRGEQEPGMLQSSLIHRLASRAGAASRLLCWLAVLLVSLPLAAFAATDADGVGIAAIEVTDPVGGGPMPGFVFYPSTKAGEGTTAIGPYDVAAAFGVPEPPGAKPLVVISHGHGGSNPRPHHLAAYLARHGIIVPTIAHPTPPTPTT